MMLEGIEITLQELKGRRENEESGTTDWESGLSKKLEGERRQRKKNREIKIQPSLQTGQQDCQIYIIFII